MTSGAVPLDSADAPWTAASLVFEVPERSVAVAALASVPGVEPLRREGVFGIEPVDSRGGGIAQQLAELIRRWSEVAQHQNSEAIAAANLRVGLDGPGTGGFSIADEQLCLLACGPCGIDLFVDAYGSEPAHLPQLSPPGSADAGSGGAVVITPRPTGPQPEGAPRQRWARTRLSLCGDPAAIAALADEQLLTREGSTLHVDCPLQDDVHVDQQLDWAERVLQHLPPRERVDMNGTGALTTTLGIDDSGGQYCFTVNAELIAALARAGLAYQLICPMPAVSARA